MSEETLTADVPEPRPASHRAGGGLLSDRATLFKYGVWLALALVVLTPPLYFEPSWLRVGQYVMIGAVGGDRPDPAHRPGRPAVAGPPVLHVRRRRHLLRARQRGQAAARSGFGLPSLVALFGAILVAAALGLAFAPVAGRVRGVYLGVATLSLVYVGLYLGQQWTSLSGGTASGRPSPDLNFFGIKTLSNDPEITFLGRAMEREQRVWYLFLALRADRLP